MKAALAIFLLMFSLNSCDDDYSCGEIGNCTEEEDGKYYGYIPFNDSTAYWLAPVPENVINFKNDKGFSCQFNLHKDTSSEKGTVAIFWYQATKCCKEQVRDYVKIQNLDLVYRPVKSLFNIEISKRKIVPYYPDTVKLDGHRDILNIRIADANCSFATGDSAVKDNKILFMSSVTLDGQQFNEVYQITNIYNYYYASLRVEEIYFKTGIGVVAFKLSNGEIWTKQ